MANPTEKKGNISKIRLPQNKGATRCVRFIHLLMIFHLFTSAFSYSQTKNEVRLGSITESADIIKFEVVSTSAFYVGANPYVLHIGDFAYWRYVESKKDGLWVMTFEVPRAQYEQWPSGNKVLVYGYYWRNFITAREGGKYLGPHWILQ